jgi:hypothetical protein
MTGFPGSRAEDGRQTDIRTLASALPASLSGRRAIGRKNRRARRSWSTPDILTRLLGATRMRSCGTTLPVDASSTRVAVVRAVTARGVAESTQRCLQTPASGRVSARRSYAERSNQTNAPGRRRAASRRRQQSLGPSFAPPNNPDSDASGHRTAEVLPVGSPFASLEASLRSPCMSISPVGARRMACQAFSCSAGGSPCRACGASRPSRGSGERGRGS